MPNRNYIVLTHDAYLRCSIESLMETRYLDKTLCFCDVDTFSSLDELSRAIESNCDDVRVIIISRGLWISRVLGSLVDLEMTDDFNKWRFCINKGRKNYSAKIIEKLHGIKRLNTLTRRELDVFHLLQLTTTINDAAKLANREVKFFQATTISIARKYNLRNSNELHFFIRKFTL